MIRFICIFVFFASQIYGEFFDKKELISIIENKLFISDLELLPTIHGGDNKIFFIKQQDRCIGIAKCYTKRSISEVKNIVRISQQLSEQLPTPPIYQLFLFKERMPVVIQGFIQGEHVLSLNHYQLEHLVLQIAKIHAIKMENKVINNKEFDYSELFEKAKSFPQIEDVKKVYDSIDLNYLQHLPTALIHGDITPSNVLFDGDHIVSILDLDHARFSYRLTDLARMQIFFAFNESGQFEKAFVIDFLKKYNRYHPLVLMEYDYFYRHMKLLLIKMILETYYYVEVLKEVPQEIFQQPTFNQSWEVLLKKLYSINDDSPLKFY